MSAGDFGTAETCPNCDATTYREWRGVQVQGVYDGILYWLCPECDHAWPRFDDDAGRLSELGRQYADAYNADRHGGSG